MNKNAPTFKLLRDPFPPDPPEDLKRYHIEHDPKDVLVEARKTIVRAVMKRASKKKTISKAKQKRRAVYKPEYEEDFGLASDMQAFDEIYDKFYGSYEAGLKYGDNFGGGREFNDGFFTKKAAGLGKSVILSATERRLNLAKKRK